jgi:ribonucleotide monophosphatase NagD (HAD superfamily)
MTDTPRLSDLAADYDALLCDVWGVIRDGRSIVPEALDALAGFRAQGGTVVLLSNSPRRASSIRSSSTATFSARLARCARSTPSTPTGWKWGASCTRGAAKNSMISGAN